MTCLTKGQQADTKAIWCHWAAIESVRYQMQIVNIDEIDWEKEKSQPVLFLNDICLKRC
uniref:Uncharacterized protein n=1 Tax=Castor canadensis TaxID=51338 RepID=A0A8C0XR51_CASCN